MTQEIKPKSSLEIVRAMRNYINALVDSGYPAVFNRDAFLGFADDLEKAIKRERETVTPCHGMDAPQPVTPRNRLGNVAKMREALHVTSKAAREIQDKTEEADTAEVAASILEICVRALLLPARNCDRCDDDDDAFALYHESLKDGDVVCLRGGLRWAFAPAALDDEGPKCSDGLRGVPDCTGCRVHC